MSSPYRVVVVIPAHNEQHRLPATLAALAAAEVPGAVIEHIYIAENGSDDETIAVAEQCAAAFGLPLTALALAGRGKAAALAEVMPFAAAAHPGADGVLFMDADNATDFGELRHFDLSDRTSVQIASRHLPGSIIVGIDGDRSLARRFLSWGMRMANKVLLWLPVRDTQCGFKLFPRTVAGPLFTALENRSWVFDAELLARARAGGLRLREHPVRWVEMPGSKVRPVADAIGSLLGLVSIRLLLWREMLSAEGRRRLRLEIGR